MSYPFNIVSTPAVTVTGTSGATLAQGDVVTGAAVRDIIITQGNSTRVLYTVRTPDTQRGAHMLQLNISGTWTDTMEADEGDWSYYGVSVTATADQATVVYKSNDAVEVAFQWDAFDLSTFSGGGVQFRDWTANANLNYPESSAVVRRISATKLIKTIRVQRGEPGYYVGWHSDPRVGPNNRQLSTLNVDNAWGERELGLGGGSAVGWSSGRSAVARWPAWADDVDGRWTAAGLSGTANKIYWCGQADPTFAPYDSAGWISAQGSGYPNTQTTGPFYVADIHYSIAVAKIMVSRIARCVGFWKVGTRGAAVSVYTNEDHSASGVPYQHQWFIGVRSYTADSSSAYANEPSASLQSWASSLASSLDWPEV
jgi:hypothetical protein